MKQINYALTKGRRPASWQLPIKKIMLTKYVNGKSLGQKKIQYVLGQDSIFKEDHKGDQEASQVWFEDGVLQVNPENKNLIKILDMHPFNGIHFEKVDYDVQATKDIDVMALRVKAYEAVGSSDPNEMKARAFVLLGAHVIDQSDAVTEANLKKLAFEDPAKVLLEMKNPDYKAKTVAALAILRGVLMLNPTNTQISWSDSGKALITIAVGQDPITKLGQFLSSKDQSAKITLQEIGERITRSYNFKKDYTATDELKEVLGDDMPEDIVPNVAKSKIKLDEGIEDARKEFKLLFEREVPVNKKNDLEWIKDKIKEGNEE